MSHTALHGNFKLYYVSSLRSKTKLPFYSIWLPALSLSPITITVLSEGQSIRMILFSCSSEMRCTFCIHVRVHVYAPKWIKLTHNSQFYSFRIPNILQFLIIHSFIHSREKQRHEWRKKSTEIIFYVSNKMCVVCESLAIEEEKISISCATGNIVCGICWLLSAWRLYYVEKNRSDKISTVEVKVQSNLCSGLRGGVHEAV